VRLVDLKKIFSIQKGDVKEEVKILTVKDNGEYKGLMINQVLERLSIPSDIVGAPGEYFLGTMHWTYQERPVEVPVLDLKKF
jgi:chemotaxis signal transduction protein